MLEELDNVGKKPRVKKETKVIAIAEDLSVTHHLCWIGSGLHVVNKDTGKLTKISEKKAISSWGKEYVYNAVYIEGFTTDTIDNLNWQWLIDKKLNGNYPLRYKPVKGNCSLPLQVVQQVCGEYSEKILECIALKIKNPYVKLPVVMLLSEENDTGKSSFVEMIADLFGENATKIRTQDISGRFNGSWVSKQFVYVDEVGTGVNKWANVPTIKEIATAEVAYSEKKGMQAEQVKCNVWLMMCSNDVYGAMPVEKADTRVWPIKVPSLPDGLRMKRDVFKVTLKQQMPAFLYYLLNDVKIDEDSRHRLYVDPKLYSNQLKKDIINESKTSLVKDISRSIKEVFVNNEEIDELVISKTQLAAILGNRQVNTTHIDISLLEEFGIKYKGTIKPTTTNARQMVHSVSLFDGNLEIKTTLMDKPRGGYLFSRSNFDWEDDE